MTLGGGGIARLQAGPDAGLVLFVPFSAPGDVLKVRILEKKKNFGFAEIVEIVTPSPSRVQAPCSIFGKCGGCNWQHLSYPEQLKQKQLIVLEQLTKSVDSKTEVLPIVPSPQELRYRNRIQIHIQGKKWGYFARKSHQLVPTEDCLIAEEPLVEKLNQFSKTAQDSRYQIALKTDHSVNFEDCSAESEESDGLAFSQVNRFQNEALVKRAIEWSSVGEAPPWPEIWDLYAGAGNFTFPLFEKHRKSKIIAVELAKKSVESAQNQIRAANISPQKMQFLLSDVEAFLKRGVLANQGLILLDPPRSGCSDGVINFLAAQSFQKILYISCNPATLARDLVVLRSKSRRPLRLNRLQAFDMFPQTDHVEVLAELVVDEIPS